MKPDKQSAAGGREAFLRDLLTATSDAAVVEDLDGQILAVNPAFLALVGWDKPFTGQPLDELLALWRSRFHRPEVLEGYFQSCRAGTPPASPFVLETRPGFTLEAHCIETRAIEGPGCRMWLLRERRPSAQLWLNREIRNPLSGVLGFVDLLKEDLAEVVVPEKTRSLLRGLAFGTKQLHSVLNEPTGARDLVSVPEWVPLDTLLEDLELQYRYRFQRRGIELLIEAPSCTGVQLLVDPGRLVRVLDHLLGNALNFTPRGWVALRVAQTPEAWTFVVEDSGVGIAPARQKELLQPSVGLGTTICDAQVRSLGGTLGLESEPGHGSRFTVTLPGLRSRSDEGDCTDGGSEGKSGPTILLADDEKTIHLLIQGFLKGTGVTLLEASDGVQAVELWSLHRPEVVLMDLRMPRLSGRDAARRIMAIDPHTSTRLLAMSAISPAAKDLADGRPLWSGYLAKPFTRQGLLRFLSRYVTLGGES